MESTVLPIFIYIGKHYICKNSINIILWSFTGSCSFNWFLFFQLVLVLLTFLSKSTFSISLSLSIVYLVLQYNIMTRADTAERILIPPQKTTEQILNLHYAFLHIFVHFIGFLVTMWNPHSPITLSNWRREVSNPPPPHLVLMRQATPKVSSKLV